MFNCLLTACRGLLIEKCLPQDDTCVLLKMVCEGEDYRLRNIHRATLWEKYNTKMGVGVEGRVDGRPGKLPWAFSRQRHLQIFP